MSGRWHVGTLFVCLLIEQFPLGWITHSMMTWCSRAKNDAPRTPVYSDSFKWIPYAVLPHPPHAADPSASGNIGCYGSRLFDIQLIRKYQVLHFLHIFVYFTRCVLCVCTGLKKHSLNLWQNWHESKMFDRLPAHLTTMLKCAFAFGTVRSSFSLYSEHVCGCAVVI